MLLDYFTKQAALEKLRKQCEESQIRLKRAYDSACAAINASRAIVQKKLENDEVFDSIVLLREHENLDSKFQAEIEFISGEILLTLSAACSGAPHLKSEINVLTRGLNLTLVQYQQQYIQLSLSILLKNGLSFLQRCYKHACVELTTTYLKYEAELTNNKMIELNSIVDSLENLGMKFEQHIGSIYSRASPRFENPLIIYPKLDIIREIKKYQIAFQEAHFSFKLNFKSLRNILLERMKKFHQLLLLLNKIPIQHEETFAQRAVLIRLYYVDVLNKITEYFSGCIDQEQWSDAKRQLLPKIRHWYMCFLMSIDISDLYIDSELLENPSLIVILLEYLVSAKNFYSEVQAEVILKKYYQNLSPQTNDLRVVLKTLEQEEKQRCFKISADDSIKNVANFQLEYTSEMVGATECLILNFTKSVFTLSAQLDKGTLKSNITITTVNLMASAILHFCTLLEACKNLVDYEFFKEQLLPKLQQHIMKLLKKISVLMDEWLQSDQELSAFINETALAQLIALLSRRSEAWSRLIRLEEFYHKFTRNDFKTRLKEQRTIMSKLETTFRIYKLKKPPDVFLDLDHEDWLFGKSLLELTDTLKGSNLKAVHAEVTFFLTAIALYKYHALWRISQNRTTDEIEKKLNKELKICYHPDKLLHKKSHLTKDQAGVIYNLLSNAYTHMLDITKNAVNKSSGTLQYNQMPPSKYIEQIFIFFIQAFLYLKDNINDQTNVIIQLIHSEKASLEDQVMEAERLLDLSRDTENQSHVNLVVIEHSAASLLEYSKRVLAYETQIDELVDFCERISLHLITFVNIAMDLSLDNISAQIMAHPYKVMLKKKQEISDLKRAIISSSTLIQLSTRLALLKQKTLTPASLKENHLISNKQTSPTQESLTPEQSPKSDSKLDPKENGRSIQEPPLSIFFAHQVVKQPQTTVVNPRPTIDQSPA